MDLEDDEQMASLCRGRGWDAIRNDDGEIESVRVLITVGSAQRHVQVDADSLRYAKVAPMVLMRSVLGDCAMSVVEYATWPLDIAA